MAHAPGTPHRREALVEMLWPECGLSAGRSSLSTALWSLRHELEPTGFEPGSVLLADRHTIAVRRESVGTDVAEFERLLRAAAAAGPAERQELSTAALELYAGEFMAGYYEDWVLAEQRRLGDLAHRALGEVTAVLEEVGDLAHALEHAWRAVRLDPLGEEHHARLMRLQTRAGHPELALQQYRELERLVQKDLHVAPSEAVRAVAREALKARRTLPATDR